MRSAHVVFVSLKKNCWRIVGELLKLFNRNAKEEEEKQQIKI
jgi:hypothetical protein